MWRDAAAAAKHAATLEKLPASSTALPRSAPSAALSIEAGAICATLAVHAPARQMGDCESSTAPLVCPNLMLLLLSPILMVQMVLGIPAYLFREPGNGMYVALKGGHIPLLWCEVMFKR